MNKEEIQEYLKRVDELELKLDDEDKDTLQWLIFGYNECAKLLYEKEQELDRLNNVINELSDFVIKIYKKEMDKTSDWWLQEELCTSFDDINLATNFRLEKELMEEK